MSEINDLYDMFERNTKFKLFAIHSEIPFEDQEAAFLPVEPDEIKIIIATNAAESSVTLPDVDLVICLGYLIIVRIHYISYYSRSGTHKASQYLPGNHRLQIRNTWISKASATQRAGRTGRLRPVIAINCKLNFIYVGERCSTL